MAEELVEIMVRCPRCLRTAPYAPSGLRLTLLRTVGGVECYYEFFCLFAGCKGYNRVGLEPAHAARLVDSGVVTRVFEVPAEVVERGGLSTAVLSDDDLAEFIAQLALLDENVDAGA